MKQLLLIFATVALTGCGTTSWVSDPSNPNNVFYELTIRKNIGKPTGELTKADLERVKKLEAVNKGLTDVKGLGKLTQLKLLDLGINQLTSAKGLEKLTQLEALSFSGNQLTSVKGLEKLTQLKSLNLNHNPPLTKAQIDQLKKALPNCKIDSWK